MLLAYDHAGRFEWDPAQDRSNQAKHGITFDEAKTLFTDGVDYLE